MYRTTSTFRELGLMRLKPLLSIMLLAALGAGPALARDLGVQGQLWEIDEIDLRVLLTEIALDVDTEKVVAERLASANKYLDTLTQFNLPPATETKTTWLDPTTTLEQDIKIPVKQANGEYIWKVIYPKGFRFNALERMPMEPPRMLFFNGSKPDETAFVIAAMKSERPGVLMPVSTGGNPKTLSEQFKGPVFYATPAILKRFGIRATPSLFAVGKAERKKYMAITTFSSPFQAKTVQSAWWGLPSSNAGGTP